MIPITTIDGREQRLELMTLSVGVSHVLDFSLSINRPHFDHVTVATSPEDTGTKDVCRKHAVDCLVTNVFYKNGVKFDKGAARDLLFRSAKLKEFVLYLDPDILVHPSFRQDLSRQKLDVDVLYGADRVLILNERDMALFSQNRLCAPVSMDWGFGYFNLFHCSSKWLAGKGCLVESYPTEKEPFGSEDYLFRKQFGGPHYFINDQWHWDLSAQQRLGMWCFHLGPPGEGSKNRPKLQ